MRAGEPGYRSAWRAIALALAYALTSCGGGGGGGESAPANPTITVSASGPSGRVANGSTVTLDVVVTNSGMSEATNVVTDIEAYDFVGIVGIDCEATAAAVCPVTSQRFPGTPYPNSLRLRTAVLPAQASLRFRVTELIQSVVSGPNTTLVSAMADGPGAGIGARSQVVVTSYIDQLNVTGGALTPTVAPGGSARYVMALSNAGPDAASDVVVTNEVGPGQTLVSASCVSRGGAVCPVTASNGASMRVPSIPVGGSLVFTMTATVSAGATGLLSDIFRVIDPADRFQTDNARVAFITAVPAAGGSFLTLESDPGEALGGGASYAYTQADAVFTVTADSDGLLGISVAGNESWAGSVRFAGPVGRVQPGTYDFTGSAQAGLFQWFGNNGGCSLPRAQVVVESVAYAGNILSAIDLRFDQMCEGSAAALHGRLHWSAADASMPPGPVDPAPPGLWRAPAAGTPGSGNYIYLESDANDPLGAGATTLLTQSNSIVAVKSSVPGEVELEVKGDESISAAFRGVFAEAVMRRGYYGPLQTWPARNPAVGTMRWSQGSRGCNANLGWFVIDDVRYAGSSIDSIDARFELHCEGLAAALRGQIHWAPGDLTAPPGPVNPPPANLWTPAAGATPATGNYVYLQSDSGDFVGGGGAGLLRAEDNITVTANGVDLVVGAGEGFFTGEFVGMNSIPRLLPGYYPQLQRYPFNNPTRGGLTVGTAGKGCNVSSGWFIVDRVVYEGAVLKSIDLRFEQHCENAVPALHGKIHWASG